MQASDCAQTSGPIREYTEVLRCTEVACNTSVLDLSTSMSHMQVPEVPEVP